MEVTTEQSTSLPSPNDHVLSREFVENNSVQEIAAKLSALQFVNVANGFPARDAHHCNQILTLLTSEHDMDRFPIIGVQLPDEDTLRIYMLTTSELGVGHDELYYFLSNEGLVPALFINKNKTPFATDIGPHASTKPTGCYLEMGSESYRSLGGSSSRLGLNFTKQGRYQLRKIFEEIGIEMHG